MSLKVLEYTSTSSATRSSTNLMVKFMVPNTSEKTIVDKTLGYVTLHLPHMWGSVF